MPFSMGTNIFGPSKTKDQKRKQKFTNKEGVGPREVPFGQPHLTLKACKNKNKTRNK